MNKIDKEIWVFLSHSNKDYDKVRVVRNLLEEQKFRPIMFFLCCLEDDEEINDLIKREIDSRTRFILCDSENARQSNWVQKELEYIKSKERTYQTIDLSKSEEEIAKELKSYRSSAEIFISYKREDMLIAEELHTRLNKYDFFAFIDSKNLRPGRIFVDEIKSNIEQAINFESKGLFVTLINKRTFNSIYGREELDYAIESGGAKKILAVIMEPNIQGLNYLKFMDCQYIDVSESISKVDSIIDAILRRTLDVGSLLTLAKDFRQGLNRAQDIHEAEICWKIYEERANLSINPYAEVSLAKEYEAGLAVEKDLSKALEYYTGAVANGLMQYMKDCERVRDLIKKEKENL